METSRSTSEFSRMLVSRGCEHRERGSEQKSSTVLLVHGMGAEDVRFESKLSPTCRFPAAVLVVKRCRINVYMCS
jgi:predicted esterase